MPISRVTPVSVGAGKRHAQLAWAALSSGEVRNLKEAGMFF